MNKNILLLLNKSIEFYNSVTDSLYKMHIKSVVILLPKNMNICNTMRDVGYKYIFLKKIICACNL